MQKCGMKDCRVCDGTAEFRFEQENHNSVLEFRKAAEAYTAKLISDPKALMQWKNKHFPDR